MTAGAPAGIPGTEANQEAADHQKNEPAKGQQAPETEQLLRQDLRMIPDAIALQLRQQPRRHLHRFQVRQEPGRDERPYQDPAREEQVPGLPFPVVLEEFDVRWEAGRADMPERGRDPEMLAAEQQQRGNGKSDDDPSHIPGPGLKEY